jgi:hypothetical protein
MAKREMDTVNITQSVIDTKKLGQTQNGDISASLETMEELERRFNEVRDQIAKATQLRRLARAAVARAEAANAMQVALQAEFIHFVGLHCPKVAEWDVWPLPPRKDENGDIILQTPIDSTVLQRSAEAMHRQITEGADRILKDRPEAQDFGGMFGGPDEQQ